MKRYLLLIVVALFVLACEEHPTDSSQQSETELNIEGYWYMVYDSNIYTLDVRTGSAIFVVYGYDGSEWSREETTLVYTISNREIVVQIADQDAWSASVAVTGDVMSISNDLVAYVFLRYDGLESSLQEVMNDIEENYLDQTPGDTIIGDTIISESQIEMAIAAIYMSMIEAVAEQLNLENIRINGVDLYGVSNVITSSSQQVLDTWSKWYKTVNYTNMIISNVDRELYSHYYDEAVVAKAFAFYNLAMLYGVVVVSESIDSCEVYNASEALDMVDDMLSSSRTLEDGMYRFSNSDVAALRAEISMYRGVQNYELSTLAESADFELYVDISSYPNFYDLFGETITIYSPARIELLKREIKGEDVVSEWLTLNEDNYGYWPMLKRTGRACKIARCEEYELLMPIPEFEIMRYPNLVQNDGY